MSRIATRPSPSLHEGPWPAWAPSKSGRCGKGHRRNVRVALPGLLAPLVIAGPGRVGPLAVLAPAHSGQTGQPIVVLASGAGRMARGRTGPWRFCLPLVGLHKDVWAMGPLAVAHPCSPLLVQCGLPWESRPAIVPEPEVTLRRRFQDSPEPPQPGMVPPGAAHTV